jgi:hypothetical protein
MLPTPRAIYGEHPGMTDPKHLTGAAMLPTPKQRDFRSAEGEAGIRRDSPDLNVTIAHGTGMKLSAAWVTRLMGYPDSWLDLDPSDSDPLGKPASRALRSTRPTA